MSFPEDKNERTRDLRAQIDALCLEIERAPAPRVIHFSDGGSPSFNYDRGSHDERNRIRLRLLEIVRKCAP